MELQLQDRLHPRSHASLRSASNMSLSPELLRVVCPYPEQGQQNAAPGYCSGRVGFACICISYHPPTRY